MTHATCCDKPHYAKGLCRSHYRKQEPRIKVNVPCATCGQTCTKYRDDTRQRASYCSYQCRADGQFGPNRPGRRSKELVHVGSVYVTEIPAYQPARRTPSPSHHPTLFVSGVCRWCGESYTVQADHMSRTRCSTSCPGPTPKHGKFQISQAKRQWVYERDQWLCQLCMLPVDPHLHAEHPLSATLDHIICQSWTDKADHTVTNLRLAHRLCNSMRGDEMALNSTAMLTEGGQSERVSTIPQPTR